MMLYLLSLVVQMGWVAAEACADGASCSHRTASLLQAHISTKHVEPKFDHSQIEDFLKRYHSTDKTIEAMVSAIFTDDACMEATVPERAFDSGVAGKVNLCGHDKLVEYWLKQVGHGGKEHDTQKEATVTWKDSDTMVVKECNTGPDLSSTMTDTATLDLVEDGSGKIKIQKATYSNFKMEACSTHVKPKFKHSKIEDFMKRYHSTDKTIEAMVSAIFTDDACMEATVPERAFDSGVTGKVNLCGHDKLVEYWLKQVGHGGKEHDTQKEATVTWKDSDTMVVKECNTGPDLTSSMTDTATLDLVEDGSGKIKIQKATYSNFKMEAC